MDQTKTSGYEREIIGDLRFQPGFFPMPWPMDLERSPERTSTRAFLMIRLKLLTGCACASRPGRWSHKHGETIMYSCIAWSLTPGVSTKFIQFIVMFLIQYCLRAQPSESCKSFYIVNQCHSVNRISSLDIFRCEFCRVQACLFGSNMVHGWVNQLNLYSSRLNVLKGKVFGIHIASKNHYFVHRAQGLPEPGPDQVVPEPTEIAEAGVAWRRLLKVAQLGRAREIDGAYGFIWFWYSFEMVLIWFNIWFNILVGGFKHFYFPQYMG